MMKKLTSWLPLSTLLAATYLWVVFPTRSDLPRSKWTAALVSRHHSQYMARLDPTLLMADAPMLRIAKVCMYVFAWKPKADNVTYLFVMYTCVLDGYFLLLPALVILSCSTGAESCEHLCGQLEAKVHRIPQTLQDSFFWRKHRPYGKMVWYPIV